MSMLDTMPRDSDDPRLPQFTAGPWKVFESGNGWSIRPPTCQQITKGHSISYTEPEIAGKVPGFNWQETEHAGNVAIMSQAPILMGNIFCLFANFPKLRTDWPGEAEWSVDDLISLKDWLLDQSDYWEDSLRACGVELEREL